jgi:hypothetical protein
MNLDPKILQQAALSPSLSQVITSQNGGEGGEGDEKTKKPFPLLAVAGIGLLALLLLRSK